MDMLLYVYIVFLVFIPPFFPFMISLLILRVLKKNLKPITVGITMMLISFVPIIGLFYLAYEALTCGKGFFNGLFFLFFTTIPSIALTIIFGIINNFYRNNYKKVLNIGVKS